MDGPARRGFGASEEAEQHIGGLVDFISDDVVDAVHALVRDLAWLRERIRIVQSAGPRDQPGRVFGHEYPGRVVNAKESALRVTVSIKINDQREGATGLDAD